MYRIFSHSSGRAVRSVSRSRVVDAHACGSNSVRPATESRAVSHCDVRTASTGSSPLRERICQHATSSDGGIKAMARSNLQKITLNRVPNRNFAQTSMMRLNPLDYAAKDSFRGPLTGDILTKTAVVLARDLSTSYVLYQLTQPQSRNADKISVADADATRNNAATSLSTKGSSTTSPATSAAKAEETSSQALKKQDSTRDAAQVPKPPETPSKVVAASTTAVEEAAKPPKLPIMTRIKNELIHYYHGFRLFGAELRISSGLSWRFLNGHQLTRREYRQLVRTSADLFRLIPFLVILVVPFLELTLPILLKLFPGMLPSTFEDKARKEAMMQKQLKMKMDMAKLLQDTMADTGGTERDAEKQKESPNTFGKAEFATFMNTIRTKGSLPSNEDIIRFSRLFSDEMTLDSLPRDQLVPLCRLLEMRTYAQPNELLRFLLRMKLRRLKADDYMIKQEGINTLTRSELATACRSRGMRSAGASADRLRMQLEQWLELSLSDEVPITLLLMSRAMYVPDSYGAEVSLAEVLVKLPERSLEEAEVKASEASGRVDYATKAKIVREEQAAIKAERKAQVAEVEAAKKSQKTATLVAVPSVADDILTKEDYITLNNALRLILCDKKILVEKEDLVELQDDFERLTASTAQPSKSPPVPAQKPAVTAAAAMAASAVPLDAVIPPQKPITPVDQQPLGKASDKTVIPISPVYVPSAAPPLPPPKSPLAALKKVVETASDKKRKAAAERLKKRVTGMIGEINTMVVQLEQEHKRVTEQVAQVKQQKKFTASTAADSDSVHVSKSSAAPSKSGKATLVKVDEIADVIRHQMKGVTDVEREQRVGKLIRAMHAMDINHDGEIDAEHVVKVLTYIAREPAGAINLTGHQMALMIDMLAKEEYLDDFKVQERVEDLIDMEEADEADMLKKQKQQREAGVAVPPVQSTSPKSVSKKEEGPR